MAPLVIASKLQAPFVVHESEVEKPNIEEWKDYLIELWRSIDWHSVRAKVQHFGDTVWKLIKHANLLSPQKLAGYGLLFSCCFPVFIFIAIKLVTLVIILVLAIASITVQLFGLIVFRHIGFTREGVRLLSPAASFQSRYYGAATPAGSLFSNMQSMGARRSITSTAANISSIESAVTDIVRFIAGAAGVYLIVDDFLHPTV